MRLGVNFAQPADTTAPEKSVEDFDQQWFQRGLKAEGQVAGKTSRVHHRDQTEQGKAARDWRIDCKVRNRSALSSRSTCRPPMMRRNRCSRASRLDRGEQFDEMAQQRRQPTLGTKEALKRAYVGQDRAASGPRAKRQPPQLARQVRRPAKQGKSAAHRRCGSMTGAVRQVGGQVAGRVGLASLDFDLPQRGTTYFFTTPRGNVEISAWPINSRLLKQLTNFACSGGAGGRCTRSLVGSAETLTHSPRKNPDRRLLVHCRPAAGRARNTADFRRRHDSRRDPPAAGQRTIRGNAGCRIGVRRDEGDGINGMQALAEHRTWRNHEPQNIEQGTQNGEVKRVWLTFSFLRNSAVLCS